MTRVFLCDDDSQAVSRYAQFITETAEKEHIEIVVSTFTSGEELLFCLIDSPNLADIIYLDILIGNTNGMDIAKKLRESGCKAEIVFLTTSENYVYDAFDVCPIQYLIKDSTTGGRFEEVFLKAVARATQKMQEMFVFESAGVTKIIPLNEISFFEIWKRIVAVHYSGGESIEFYQTLEKLEEQLEDKDFIRIHRSYLVHLPYVAKFDKQNLLLKTGESLPIGGTYTKSVRQAFSEYAVKARNLQFIK